MTLEVVEFTKRGSVSQYQGNDPVEASTLYDALDNAAIFVMRDGRLFRSAMKFRGVETASALIDHSHRSPELQKGPSPKT